VLLAHLGHYVTVCQSLSVHFLNPQALNRISSTWEWHFRQFFPFCLVLWSRCAVCAPPHVVTRVVCTVSQYVRVPTGTWSSYLNVTATAVASSSSTSFFL
jgi:hypothetical protein